MACVTERNHVPKDVAPGEDVSVVMAQNPDQCQEKTRARGSYLCSSYASHRQQ